MLASLYFYLWGSGEAVYILIASIVVNYYIGILMNAQLMKKKSGIRKVLLIVGVSCNLAVLIYYKYSNFFYEQLSLFFENIGIYTGSLEKIILPAAISFYTFMAISYLVEVYRRQTAARNIIDFATYLSLFPHLVAGPIVRYSEIERELEEREIKLEMMFEGIWRFAIGLSKKVLIANNIGVVADKVFDLPQNELTTGIAWIGIICYTLQIYFDFSGYTDMAIGLAKFMGFNFPENFNQPYRSQSVTEFWRRWHMSLSRWFRDFLYIPLGGSRKGPVRTYVNLFIVFFLCGLWHGASWSFVVWGMYQGVILIIERLLKQKYNFEPKGFLGWLVTFNLIMIGWVFFRSSSLEGAFTYIKSMFSFGYASKITYFEPMYFLQNNIIVFAVIGFVIAFVPHEKIKVIRNDSTLSTIVKGIISLLVFILSAASIAKSGFQPFIYFQF
ncbi:MBOAT family O-acyltransferase [Paenibacillus sp. GCM10012306]|uniref:MBOAT family O-acyltransferase n=1 Tax=Paenibacillus sp. GCM10012306 TaxID=3317342 RepID=UPI0036D27BD8